MQWDRLIPQANITLNLLCTAQANPVLSAYSYHFGRYDFAATPMAPPGTKMVPHIDAKARAAWELNGEVGWYVGLFMNHYRCVKSYFPRTRATRTFDTMIFSAQYPLPTGQSE